MGTDKIKVMVVDDEKIVRDFFKRLLSLLGLEVQDAEDGYKAMELCRKEKFDLFFVDMRMPGMNGLETYREIRKINPDAVVVMTTGYAVEDMLEQAQKEGAYSAIRKPFDISQIKEIINKFADGAPAKSMNILVIDDDESILSFFSAFLAGKSLKYKICKDKLCALEAVKKEKFDLVFLDLLLKDVNGMQVYSEIKEVYPEANIVLMSGHHKEVNEAKDKIDVAGCLYKPFEIQSVIGYIEQIKSKKHD